MNGEGFALTTDVNNRLLEDIHALVPEKLPEHPFGLGTLSMGHDGERQPTDSAVAVALVVSSLSRPLREANDGGFIFEQTYGITRRDKEQADAFFELGRGLTTLDFTWHAAPALAVAAVHSFEDAGLITREQQQNMTLHDWANIIGTGWFSRLSHSMAYAKNATYRTLGMKGEDLQPKGLTHCLKEAIDAVDENMEPFVIQEEYEPIEALWYTTASLTESLKKALRKSLHPDGLTKDNLKDMSPGCPGARFVTMLPADTVRNNKHIQSLIKRGDLAVDEARSTAEKIRLTQEYSAIDNALILLAAKLDQYQNLYGMPQLDRLTFNGGVTHAHNVPDVDALRRKTPLLQNI